MTGTKPPSLPAPARRQWRSLALAGCLALPACVGVPVGYLATPLAVGTATADHGERLRI
jgi:hypothetical protein